MRKILALTAVLSTLIISGGSSAFAWSGPSATPPAGNVSEPLNSGATNQDKSGRLLLNTGDNSYGLLIYGSSESKGQVGIGVTSNLSYKLHVNGLVGATAFYYLSDERTKENIKTLQNSLEKVQKLRGVSFTMKSTGDKSVGLIAQEVEKVYPELVKTAKDGMKSVEYGNLVGPLIEAIKEQQAQIESLKARVAELEARAN